MKTPLIIKWHNGWTKSGPRDFALVGFAAGTTNRPECDCTQLVVMGALLNIGIEIRTNVCLSRK